MTNKDGNVLVEKPNYVAASSCHLLNLNFQSYVSQVHPKFSSVKGLTNLGVFYILSIRQ